MRKGIKTEFFKECSNAKNNEKCYKIIYYPSEVKLKNSIKNNSLCISCSNKIKNTGKKHKLHIKKNKYRLINRVRDQLAIIKQRKMNKKIRPTYENVSNSDINCIVSQIDLVFEMLWAHRDINNLEYELTLIRNKNSQEEIKEKIKNYRIKYNLFFKELQNQGILPKNIEINET